MIEVMIATALFTVIVVISIGAVLSVAANHKRVQGMRVIVDNLSFIMEDMARNVRLGNTFHCDNSSPLNVAVSCPSGLTKLVFEGVNGDPAVDADQIIYLISQTNNQVLKSKDGGTTYSNLTEVGEVTMDLLRSGFIVTGAESGDNTATRVIIRLSGVIHFGGIDSPFDLQTTVSPRQAGA